MINIPDCVQWNELSDEDQSTYCMAIVGEYTIREQVLHDMMLNDYFGKDPVATAAIVLTHDWRRMKTNLKLYAEPNILGEDKSVIRFQTLNKLYHVCALLEYVNARLK